MLKFAVAFEGPVAVRYPRGEAYTGLAEFRAPVELGRAEVLRQGRQVAVLAVGSRVAACSEALEALRARGFDPTFVNMRFVKPFDRELVEELAKTHGCLVTVEENVKTGGFGEQVLAFIQERRLAAEVEIIALPDAFISHGSVAWQERQAGIDAGSIETRILDCLQRQAAGGEDARTEQKSGRKDR